MTARWPQLRAAMIALAIGFGLLDGLPLPDRPAPWEVSVVDGIRRVRSVVSWPVRWITPTFRVSQQWALYTAPETERWRMWLEVLGRDGRWELVYRSADPDHRDYANIVEAGRVRSVWDFSEHQPRQFDAFASWLMGRALDDHPDASRARLRMEKVHLSSDGVAPLGKFAYVHVRDRGQP